VVVQLPMLLVPVNTKVASSNIAHGDPIKFVSDLRQVGGFLRALRLPLPIKLTSMI
jgi:hypothetical protein